MPCPYVLLAIEQVFRAAQVARALLAHRRGEQDRAGGGDAGPHQGLGDGNERGEPARVVRDSGALETLAAALHPHLHVRSEDGVQMGGQYHRRRPAPPPPSPLPPEPPPHVPRLVNEVTPPAPAPEQLRGGSAARRHRPRGPR